MTVRLICGDCLEILPELPDSSVNLIATDPPYYRVKSEPWDRRWDSAGGFLAWLDRVLAEFQRVLTANGSLYLFASPEMSDRVSVAIRERFNVQNRIRWLKEAGWHKKAVPEALRSYLSPWEEIIFAEHYGADNAAKGESGWGAKCDELRGFIFEPLRAYLDSERRRAGLTKAQVNRLFDGPNVGQYWWQQRNWQLPTAENYHILRQGFHDLNHGGEYLRREYEDLRREYEDLRREYEDLRAEYEDLRRPFNATPERPYTDVWDFPTVSHYPGKHPCEKPLAMMEHIVLTSSRPGDVVLDAFQGGGTTGEAATKHRRGYIGIEMSQRWHQVAQRRIEEAQMQIPLPLA